MVKDEDKYYIQKVLKGNPGDFSYIINKYKKIAFTLAIRILKNREDAEEAAQDAFIKCYYALPYFNNNSDFSTWLYRIVYNCSISMLRKRNSSLDTITDDFDDNGNGIDFSVDNLSLNKLKEEEQKQYINLAFEKLNSEESLILTLYYQLDNSIEEIAKIMEISKSNVKIKLFRTRKKFKIILDNILKNEVSSLL